ncbi:MAG: polysaccharide deacetylase family protein [Oscillospiraceae bacterium]|nr:polysaccharide deacetylase family protein [Oscillospiraceae bacterium]
MRWWRRLTALLLCAALLGGPVRAGEGGRTRFVALTFDDGPTCALTDQLLDGLRARYVPATFFLCGYRVDQCPDTVRRMAAEGHELAIHGQTHTFLHNQSEEFVHTELEGAAARIEALTGTRPRLFRPPGGLTGDALLSEAEAMDLPIILWSVDPQDWATQDTAAVVRRVLSRVQDGDILLMHDLGPSSIAAALQIIDRLTEQGYEFCTVSELAALRGVPLEPAVSYRSFPPRTGGTPEDLG